VAYQGKLITVQDVMGVVANGTGAPRATLQPESSVCQKSGQTGGEVSAAASALGAARA